MSQQSTKPTAAEVRACLETIRAVAEAIKELSRGPLGGVPSGELFARLTPYMGLATYQRIVDTLKRVGVVREQNYLLMWTDPK